MNRSSNDGRDEAPPTGPVLSGRTDAMTGDSNLHTLLVGIDAACHRVLDPLFEADALPTLAGIVRDGASGPLQSQIPPWTASAWPSIYTGMNPGKHGVFSFLDFDGYDWTVANASHVRERTLWELFDSHGISSVVVNAPVTAPVRPFDGALVPGYMAPEDPDCHPEGLLDDVRSAIGDYRVYPDLDGSDDPETAYTDCVRQRGAAFRYLAARFEPAFGFVQFQATDSVFHRRPDDEATIRAIYEAVDRELRATFEACDPTNVVVVSDHGMGPYHGVEVRVNDVLREAGFVETTDGGRGMPSWATVRENELKTGGNRYRQDGGVAERAMAAAARLGLTSQRIGNALSRVGLADAVAAHAPSSLVSAGSTQVDFPASAAYVRSRIELGVRINLDGREPDGVVPEAEYEAVRSELADRLRALTTPSGDPVFAEVGPREDYFTGPESHRAVDVVAVPDSFDHILSATVHGEPFGPLPEPWNHKLTGIVAARGGDVDETARLDDAHIFDVAPTVLATFGVPYDERMDGSPLPIVGPAGSRSYERLERAESSGLADEGVEDRLSDLGYLE